MLRYTQIHAQLQQMLYVTLIHVLNTFPLFTVYMVGPICPQTCNLLFDFVNEDS